MSSYCQNITDFINIINISVEKIQVQYHINSTILHKTFLKHDWNKFNETNEEGNRYTYHHPFVLSTLLSQQMFQIGHIIMHSI